MEFFCDYPLAGQEKQCFLEFDCIEAGKFSTLSSELVKIIGMGTSVKKLLLL